MSTYEVNSTYANTPSKVRTNLMKQHPLTAFTHHHITDRMWGSHRVASVMPWKIIPSLWAWNPMRTHGRVTMPEEIKALVMFADLIDEYTWRLRPELSALLTVPLAHPATPRNTYRYTWSEITRVNSLIPRAGVPQRNSDTFAEPSPEILRENLAEVLTEVLGEFNLFAVPDIQRNHLLHEVHVALTS